MFTLLFFSIARAEFQVGVLAGPEELRRKSSPARISSHLENPALLSGLPFCVLVCMGNCSWFTNWVSLYEPSEGNAAFCAKRETREGKKSRALHSFRASRKMPRSPRLAHKAPVLQAIIDWTFFTNKTWWCTMLPEKQKKAPWRHETRRD